ncbi:MAG: transposase [Bacteroidales bacterium]|nr:transposase [Bacteroidales bacterium]
MEPLIPENFYHIYNHSNGNELLFRENRNYIFFLKKYEMYINSMVETYAYCLMPNHFHLLVSIKDDKEINDLILKNKFSTKYKAQTDSKEREKLISLFISKQFSKLFSSYSQAYNKVYSRMGSLFMKNFRRKHITKESYFIYLINYIHFNPVNHGFVSKPGEWKHSSYRVTLSDRSSIIKRDFVFEKFGGISNFIECHSKPLQV